MKNMFLWHIITWYRSILISSYYLFNFFYGLLLERSGSRVRNKDFNWTFEWPPNKIPFIPPLKNLTCDRIPEVSPKRTEHWPSLHRQIPWPLAETSTCRHRRRKATFWYIFGGFWCRSCLYEVLSCSLQTSGTLDNWKVKPGLYAYAISHYFPPSSGE